MRNIWKYWLSIEDYQIIEMPQDSKLLHVDEQEGKLCLWALVNPYAPKSRRSILVFGTGYVIDDSEDNFVGTTVMSDGFVWHVFDGGQV